jgi:hypothetical protein
MPKERVQEHARFNGNSARAERFEPMLRQAIGASELQVWFLAGHPVDIPRVHADSVKAFAK